MRKRRSYAVSLVVNGRPIHWEFFMLDRIAHQGKRYRLVWCLRDASPLLGVINCFRR